MLGFAGLHSYNLQRHLFYFDFQQSSTLIIQFNYHKYPLFKRQKLGSWTGDYSLFCCDGAEVEGAAVGGDRIQPPDPLWTWGFPFHWALASLFRNGEVGWGGVRMVPFSPKILHQSLGERAFVASNSFNGALRKMRHYCKGGRSFN